ncbi:transactivating tegument protein VP16 [Spheniscid alphaherpesvirus 1]|uniref:Alpha trans-inducing protein n=1 Tax=Spheniscid alphaherpesvirus 1 TaxID=2560777 RepID=A0A1R3T3J1_9ALPH|nr:transactivating tegument protein VP16 [Spheniscid alphaherpesvirus 1]
MAAREPFNSGALLTELEAYSTAMSVISYGEAGDEALECFDEDAFGVSSAADWLPVSAASAPRMALGPPKPAAPSALYTRLLTELDFQEASSIMALLEKWNHDLFSCFPINEDLYDNAVLLSTSIDEVIESADTVKIDGIGLDLNSHGSVKFPDPPTDEGSLPAYVDAVQKFFISELHAREKVYVTLLFGYCRAFVLYMRSSTAREVRGCRVADPKAEAERKFKTSMKERYYREVARLAKVLYLHLYLSVVREVSSRLYATQMKTQTVFAYMRYAWPQLRQFTCLFHPVIFNHGVVVVEGEPLTPQRLRELNYIRNGLALPMIRCGLIEEPGHPLLDVPSFSGGLPRSSGYLLQQIRRKMETYSERHPRRHVTHLRDHSYSKQLHKPNYGSTPEAMLEPPSPETVLPCDPVPGIVLTVTKSRMRDPGSSTHAPEAADDLLSKLLSL